MPDWHRRMILPAAARLQSSAGIRAAKNRPKFNIEFRCHSEGWL
jgi:hypothetical protein